LNLLNNTSDYIVYGKMLNLGSARSIPSVALEPAIFLYHQRGEEIYMSDIEKIMQMMIAFPGSY